MNDGPVSAAIATNGDPVGKTFGDFRAVRRLGQGGMGAVYLAEQISLKRQVALKFLRPELAANPVALKRFRAEAEAVARLNHANIVQIYAIGESAGVHYMALEYVDGMTLRDIVARKGSPELPICYAIIRQVAAALQRAGEAGIVHRDIKPENILVTRNVEVKVADFGLSRLLDPAENLNLTQSGTTLGTPLYMSPEQVRGQSIDPRSDIYSFGVTCYYMLSGQPPFHGQTAIEVALKHCEVTPPPLETLRPDLPAELCNLVHRMMHKDVSQRPQRGRDILRELALIQRGGTVSGTIVLPDSTGSQTLLANPAATTAIFEWPRARWVRYAVVAAIILAAVAAGAGIKLARNAWATPAVVIDDHPQLAVTSNHERLLLLAVEEAANPKPDKVREGLKYHAELGLLYLDQRRFGEAEQFFDGLQKRAGVPNQYTMLGVIGTAIALSFRDDAEGPAKATRLFSELRSKFPRYAAMLNNALPAEESINFKYWLLRALDRLANADGRLPPALERVRDEVKLRRPASPLSK